MGKKDLIKKIERLIVEKERAIKNREYDFAERLWQDIQVYLNLLEIVR